MDFLKPGYKVTRSHYSETPYWLLWRVDSSGHIQRCMVNGTSWEACMDEANNRLAASRYPRPQEVPC